MSYSERSQRLPAFKEDCGVSVLLTSIGTGAPGYAIPLPIITQIGNSSHVHRLNLTVADQVHRVEPQWNPSVEEQAIARALWMGQTREVTIIRYIIENSVE